MPANALVLATALIAGCPQAKDAPHSPTVRPDGPNRNWTNAEELVYVIGDTADQIIAPKGFVTDFASIPQSLWSLCFLPHGQFSRVVVIHDYFYWLQGCTRDQADRAMAVAMKESQVGKIR